MRILHIFFFYIYVLHHTLYQCRKIYYIKVRITTYKFFPTQLIQHRRMHTGEKPHLCPFCPYRAARRDNLRSHVRRMHKRENMYGDTFTPRPLLLAEADIREHLPNQVDHQQIPGTPLPGPAQPHPPPQAPL